MSEKKLGRPKLVEMREKLTTVTFKADAETRDAIEQLTTYAANTTAARFRVNMLKSAIIRQAVIEAAARLVKK